MKKATVANHIMRMYNWYYANDKSRFRTRDVQQLSESSVKVFGRRLGSPSTYERTFRKLRQDGFINVEEIKTPTDSIWVIK
jgi:hypothetical protein|tara:strand:+ start:71 stop:313 length:243 start_codon:yes stop_codon:yes gene_type:complete